jgi:hypothetical protein
MDYKKFCTILNKHIFESEKTELLRKLADKPERFIGLFRPTKPGAKVLQHILQSHEIRFGDALEEIITEFLKEWKFNVLPQIIIPDPASPRKTLNIDQYFTDVKTYFFIEQKVRDDHDSSKRVGQINNFEKKLEYLYGKHKNNLKGFMYFIDPDLTKNKNYYVEELKKMTGTYGIELSLLYGKELFEEFNKPQVWDELLKWLFQWKEDLLELPEIDFDKNAQESFEEIKNLDIRCWRKILENEKLWEEGIMKAIFRDGTTLKLLLEFFNRKFEVPYKKLSMVLREKITKHYT